jgi:biopolymer transport protein ExbD
MKLTRTSQINFGWLYVFPLLDVIFLLIFFFLLSSNFVLQPGISVTVPFSRFTLGPQPNQQIISITGGPNPSIYLRDQKVSVAELGPALDLTKKEGRAIVIKADRLASYDLVMAVTNAALEHGITSVALATTAPPP